MKMVKALQSLRRFADPFFKRFGFILAVGQNQLPVELSKHWADGFKW